MNTRYYMVIIKGIHREVESEGRWRLWKVSYYEKLSPYFIGFVVVWTHFTLHNLIELSTVIALVIGIIGAVRNDRDDKCDCWDKWQVF